MDALIARQVRGNLVLTIDDSPPTVGGQIEGDPADSIAVAIVCANAAGRERNG